MTQTIVREVHYLSDAAHHVAAHHQLATEAVVEHYPARPAWYGGPPQPRGVFAYQFFDRAGGNCGYWLVDLNSVHIFATPRPWSLPKHHVCRTPETL